MGGGVSGIVRVYKGDVTTELENVRGEMVPVTRYRRTKLVSEKAMVFNSDNEKKIRNDVRKVLKRDMKLTLSPEQDAME